MMMKNKRRMLRNYSEEVLTKYGDNLSENKQWMSYTKRETGRK